jgi:hypothetical protein
VSVKSHSSFLLPLKLVSLMLRFLAKSLSLFAPPPPPSLPPSLPLLSIRSILCRTPCRPRDNRKCYPAVRLSGSFLHLWIYLALLPLQVAASFHYLAIPRTTFASFLLLGLLEIGQEMYALLLFYTPYPLGINHDPFKVKTPSTTTPTTSISTPKQTGAP